jgi:hypothetical protein
MPVTFKCECVPCPDIKSRSVCTAQAGLSPPSGVRPANTMADGFGQPGIGYFSALAA